MSKQTLRRTQCLTALVLWVACHSAHAVWNESVRIVGTPPPSGATVRLELPSGEVVQGEVSSNEDDDEFLLFEVPGSSPRAGVVVVSINGQERRYTLGEHAPTDRLSLNLADSAVSVRAVVTHATHPQWQLGIGLSAHRFQSDYFDNVIRDQASVLGNVLTGLGGADPQLSAGADDSGSAWDVELMVRRTLGSDTALYFELGYTQTDAFDGANRGIVDVAGNSVEGIGIGSSELDIFNLGIGLERAFASGSAWRWYVGLGNLWSELDDESRSVLLVNGMEFQSATGSSNDHDQAQYVEAGIRYQVALPRQAIEFDLGVMRTNELFFDAHGVLSGLTVRWFFNL